MKRILSIVMLAAFMCFGFTAVNAQTDTSKTVGHEIKKGAKKTGHAVKKGAKATGHAVKKGAQKTAEVGAKGFSKVVDKTYDGKVGPNGETVYINDKSEYYYVDKKGKRHYVAEAELKEKAE